MDNTLISSTPWGDIHGAEIYLFRISNSSGAFVELTNYGATLVSVNVPDKQGRLGNVVLGFSSIEGYLNDVCYIGSTIGRYANRIAKARFMLDGTVYFLEPNDHGNTNHGGTSGFNSRVFDFCIEEDSLSFSLMSRDGEGGYPGNLELKVDYKWNDQNELLINYTAVSDKKTIANFTNHSYFNLSAGSRNGLEQRLTIHADHMLEHEKSFLPTAVIVPVGNKSFRQNIIADKMNMNGGPVPGFNDYYIINKNCSAKLHPACKLSDDLTGRSMEVLTSYPGVLLYTGDYLFSSYPGNRSMLYRSFDGVCLECQYFPDSPSHPSFPSTVINAGELYKENILFRFSVNK